MNKINKHIEIVRSSVPGLSSMGQESCDMILQLLSKHYKHVGVTIINTTADLDALIMLAPDLVFLGIKKIPVSGTKKMTWVSAYLDEHGINYTGSPAAAIALDFDKPSSKLAVAAAGLRTSAHFVAEQNQYMTVDSLPLPFPLFIKPPNTGGGKGIGADSVVRNFAAFEHKVRSVGELFGTSALVETYLPGREFSVAIFETEQSTLLTVMPIELLTARNAQGDRILGQSVKAADTETVMAVSDGLVRNAVTDLAINVFLAIGARDYGRIDIRLDYEGVPHFLEANLIPGLAFHEFTSYFTHACLINEDMDYETMILRVAGLGLSRQNEKSAVPLAMKTTDFQFTVA